jgi:hypothetical protein
MSYRSLMGTPEPPAPGAWQTLPRWLATAELEADVLEQTARDWERRSGSVPPALAGRVTGGQQAMADAAARLARMGPWVPGHGRGPRGDRAGALVSRSQIGDPVSVQGARAPGHPPASVDSALQDGVIPERVRGVTITTDFLLSRAEPPDQPLLEGGARQVPGAGGAKPRKPSRRPGD